MLHLMKELPVCALPASELPERIARWKALTDRALTKVSEPGFITSRYSRTPEISLELNELIAAEGECCSFLAFNVIEADDHIEVELRYPKEFEGAVGALT